MRAEQIGAADDPRLADYRRAATRNREGVFVAEGRLLVRALLAASRFRVRSVLGTTAALARLEDVPAPIPVFVASPALLRDVVGYPFHRGCLAAAEAPFPPSADALVAAQPPVIVALERVTQADNVGAVFRSARAFGAGAVLLSPGTCDPLSRKALRASAGAVFAMPFAPACAWPAELVRLRAAGFTVIALTPRGEIEVSKLAPPERLVLVVGTEADGLEPATLDAADLRVRIAMTAGVDSLNVAAATAIALHRLGRPA